MQCLMIRTRLPVRMELLTLWPMLLLVFAASGLGVRTDSSVDSGWQMSWIDFWPDDGRVFGVPALIVLAKEQMRRDVALSLPPSGGLKISEQRVNASGKHLSADWQRAFPEVQ